MATRKHLIGILTGALLIAGLFLFWPKPLEEQTPELKPSQLESSAKQPRQMPTPIPSQKAESSKIALQPEAQLSQDDQKKWQAFEEILNSRNDNDPRLDSELRELSPTLRQSIKKAYSDLDAENRNARGLVVFLIARDLESAEDAQFLKKVYEESPCKSLSDCSQVADSDPHFEGVNQTTLDYPQLAGLYQLEKKLKAEGLPKDPRLLEEIRATLREARQFPSPVVQRKAEALQASLGL